MGPNRIDKLGTALSIGPIVLIKLGTAVSMGSESY